MVTVNYKAIFENKYVRWGILLLILCGLCYGFYAHGKSQQEPQIVKVEKVTNDTVKTALATAGFKLNNADTGRVVDKIEYRVAYTKPDFKATVANEAKADEVIKQVAKKDKADVVVKEEKPNKVNTEQKDLYYYGIHMEKKTGIGMYADAARDGSYGLHVRKDRLVVQVGQKYADKSVTGRVAYELIQK